MQTLRVRAVMNRHVQTIAAHGAVSIPGLLRCFRRFHHLAVVDDADALRWLTDRSTPSGAPEPAWSIDAP